MDEAVLPIARRCRSCVALSSRSRRSLSFSCAGNVASRRRATPADPVVAASAHVVGSVRKPLKPKAPASARRRRSVPPQRSALARLLVADQGPRSGRVEGHERRRRDRRRGPRHGRRPQPPRSAGRARPRLGRRQRGRRPERRPRARDTRRRRRRRPLEQRDRRRRSLLPLLRDAGEGDRRQRLGQCGGHRRRDRLGRRPRRAT